MPNHKRQQTHPGRRDRIRDQVKSGLRAGNVVQSVVEHVLTMCKA